jgi:hypothetical protein
LHSIFPLTFRRFSTSLLLLHRAPSPLVRNTTFSILLTILQQRIHIPPPLIQQRHRLPDLLQPLQVDLGDCELPYVVVLLFYVRLRVGDLAEDLSPGGDDQGVTVRASTGSIFADLETGERTVRKG